MAWKQLVKPFLDDKVLVATDGAGNILYDWYCWCLAVTQAAFGVKKAKFPSAIAAWNANPDKYASTKLDDIPIGLYIPMFYSGGQYGHVVIAYRESYEKIKIWSSPYTHKAYFDYFEGPVMETINKVGRIYGCTYVGWTRSLTDLEIVRWESDTPVLTWTKFDKKETYVTIANPTKVWNVNCKDFDHLSLVNEYKPGFKVDIYGKVRNNYLKADYLVTEEDFVKKNPVGFNDYTITRVVETAAQPEPTPEPEKPATEDSSDKIVSSQDENKNDGASNGADVSEAAPIVVTQEQFEQSLKEGLKNMEKFSEFVAEAGKGITFKPLTKKIVYIVGDLLLLAGVEVAPIMAAINAQSAEMFSQALTQALFTAGVGILLIFKLLKAKSGTKLTETIDKSE